MFSMGVSIQKLDPLFVVSLILLHVGWGVWKERNNMLFHQHELSPSRLAFKICNAIKENFMSEFLKIPSFNLKVVVSPYDLLVGKRWNLSLDLSNLVTKVKELREGVRWKAPVIGWYKVNFDGASKVNSRLASCGGVLHDENGRFVSAVVLPLGNQKNHYAEAAAAYHGLVLAKN